MRSQLKFVLMIGALSVSAGGNARTTHAAPPTDACSLLTPAQVSSVLGSPVSGGGSLTQNTKTICGWPAPGGTVPPKRVMVNIAHVSVFAGAKMGLAGDSEVITPLSGVGDEAFYDADKAGRGAALFVRKGDFAFSVRVYGFPPDQIKEKEKTLAQDALAKL
jgi:hypothetical protein